MKDKKVFIAGIGDDQGFGFAIAKAFAEAGATIIVGTWTPIYKIFTSSWNAGKFDESRKLTNGKLLEIAKVYSMDASFDYPEDVPVDIKENKRYAQSEGYTLSEVSSQVAKDFGTIDVIIHSLANAPEVKKSLLDTSRKGYLAAHSNSSYSFVSLMKFFAPHMNEGGSALTLTYIASERAVPGYGGGMSSAKAALESDTRTLAYEAGRKYNIRVNAISAGALRSRAARAIGDKGAGFIDMMIEYSMNNAPLQKDLQAVEIGSAAKFLCSKEASAITGVTLYVDNGLHAMGLSLDSPALANLSSPSSDS